jgi:hypothetical protein
MPVLVGFIFGVFVTIFGAYIYDAAAGNVSNGMSAGNQAPMVNWNVVDNEWQLFEAHVRATADNVERTIHQHTS